MTRALIYAIFICVLALGIGTGYNNSNNICNNNYMSQGIYYSVNVAQTLRVDPAPYCFDGCTSANEDLSANLRVDPAPL